MITKKITSFIDGTRKIKLSGYKYIIDMYEIDIIMLFGSDKIKALAALYDSNHTNHTNAEGITMDYLKTHGECVVVFNDKPDLNVIVHECTHATHRILHYLSIVYTYDENEVFAYLSAHLVDIVKEAYDKHKKLL